MSRGSMMPICGAADTVRVLSVRHRGADAERHRLTAAWPTTPRGRTLCHSLRGAPGPTAAVQHALIHPLVPGTHHRKVEVRGDPLAARERVDLVGAGDRRGKVV